MSAPPVRRRRNAAARRAPGSRTHPGGPRLPAVSGARCSCAASLAAPAPAAPQGWARRAGSAGLALRPAPQSPPPRHRGSKILHKKGRIIYPPQAGRASSLQTLGTGRNPLLTRLTQHSDCASGEVSQNCSCFQGQTLTPFHAIPM